MTRGTTTVSSSKYGNPRQRLVQDPANLVWGDSEMASVASASRPVSHPIYQVIVDLDSIYELVLSSTCHKRSPGDLSLIVN